MFIDNKKLKFKKSLNTSKFNEASIEITLTQKRYIDNFEERTLISQIIPKCISTYPSRIATKKYLLSLYDLQIKTDVRLTKRGLHSIVFTFTFISPYIINDNNYRIEDIIRAIEQVLYFPALYRENFSPSIINTEKLRIISVLKNRHDDREQYVYDKLNTIMFANTEFRIPATGKIKNYHNLNYNLFSKYLEYWTNDTVLFSCIGINNATKISIENMLIKNINNFKKINKSLIERKKTYRINSDISSTNFSKNYSSNIILEKENKINQSKICIGYWVNSIIGDSEFLKHYVANEILGGSSYSKLFQNVREKYSLAYSISSKISFYKSALFISAGVSHAKTNLAIKLITQQIIDIQSGKLSNTDLKIAKNNIITRFYTMQDYIYNIFYFAENFRSYHTLKNLINEIDIISKEDIICACNQWKLGKTFILQGE